jgi:hypothetical protein
VAAVEVGDFDDEHARIAKTLDATTIRYVMLLIYLTCVCV